MFRCRSHFSRTFNTFSRLVSTVAASAKAAVSIFPSPVLVMKPAEAEAIHRHVLEARLATLGEEHPLTISSINNLAVTLSAQQEYGEAADLYRRGLELSRRVLGEEHPRTVATTGNLGLALAQLGQLEEAESLLHEALEVSIGSVPPLVTRFSSSLASSMMVKSAAKLVSNT